MCGRFWDDVILSQNAVRTAEIRPAELKEVTHMGELFNYSIISRLQFSFFLPYIPVYNLSVNFTYDFHIEVWVPAYIILPKISRSRSAAKIGRSLYNRHRPRLA